MEKIKIAAIVFFKTDERVIKYRLKGYDNATGLRITSFENYVKKVGGGCINYYNKKSKNFIKQVRVN